MCGPSEITPTKTRSILNDLIKLWIILLSILKFNKNHLNLKEDEKKNVKQKMI